MLIKVYAENIHPEIVEISNDYDFIIKKSFEDFTEEEIEKAKNFRSLLCDIMGISEKDSIEIDFEASRAGVEKKIDTAIKEWFYLRGEDWKDFLKTETLDNAFQQADFDYYDLDDLIKYLRIFCN